MNHEEEVLEIPRFFWDAPQDVQRRVRQYLVGNHGHEIAEHRVHKMTAAEAIRLDRELQGTTGNCSGKCGSHTPAVNHDEEETPLPTPVMTWGKR